MAHMLLGGGDRRWTEGLVGTFGCFPKLGIPFWGFSQKGLHGFRV